LSTLFQTWARAHKVPLDNPVKKGVRPSKPKGRARRLKKGEEQRLLEAAETSSRPWLPMAIVVALETCMRQSELANLTWDRVTLKGRYPHADLPKTKNDKARRVPLSRRAVSAFRSLDRAAKAAARSDDDAAPVLPVETKDAAPVLPVETGRGIIHAFREVVHEKDFPDLRWHDLRHEAISRLFELTDLRENEIMAITGHLTSAMLTRYTHLRAEQLAERLLGGRLNRRPRRGDS
jgi:integrase